MSFNNTKTPLKPKTKAKYQLPTLPGGKYYMTEELEEKFKELFPVHSNRRIMKWFGISQGTVERFRRALGLEKDMKAVWKEQAQDIKRTCEKNGYYDSIRGKRPSEAAIEATKRMRAEGFNPTRRLKETNPRKFRRVMKKMGETRSELFRKEWLRMKYGLGRKTKLNIPYRPMSHTACSHKHSMIKSCNYFADERHPTWVCYDSETRRSEKREATAVRHGLKIVEGRETEKTHNPTEQ